MEFLFAQSSINRTRINLRDKIAPRWQSTSGVSIAKFRKHQEQPNSLHLNTANYI